MTATYISSYPEFPAFGVDNLKNVFFRNTQEATCFPNSYVAPSTDGNVDSSVFRSTSTGKFPAQIQIIPNRATSEKEWAIGEFRKWNMMAADWDGEGAEAPQASSILLAINFLRMLSATSEVPEPMLHASGRAGLFWNSTDLYGDLEFYSEGRISYFIKHKTSKHKGVVDFDGNSIPEVFVVLLGLVSVKAAA